MHIRHTPPTWHVLFSEYDDLLVYGTPGGLDIPDSRYFMTLLGEKTRHAESEHALVTYHALPLVNVLDDEAGRVQVELRRGAALYRPSSHLQVALPRPALGVPVEEKILDRSVDTQWAMDYVGTQPAYVLYQVLWDNVLECMGMYRQWNAVLRTIGADGDSLMLSLPDQGLVTCHSITYWAWAFFQEELFPTLEPSAHGHP